MRSASLWSKMVPPIALVTILAAGTFARAQGSSQPQVKPTAVREQVTPPGGQSGQNSPGPQASESAGTSPAPQGVARRDPFEPLVKRGTGRGKQEIEEKLPPGIGGLVVATMRLTGVVRGPNGMLAVVTNPQQRTYFLREGDVLFNGRIERISMEGLLITERGKDPFGRTVERQVFKRLYPSAGDQ